MKHAIHGLSKSKAKEILRDGTVHGKPITKKQRGFFGARAAGSPMKKEGRLAKRLKSK